MNQDFIAGFIGCGNMGGTLAGVAAKALGGKRLCVSDTDSNKTDIMSESFGCFVSNSKEIASSADFIVLGVKPQIMKQASAEIKDVLASRCNTKDDEFAVVSMAAGVALESLKDMLGDVPLIRIMPNIPCASGEGVILYCKNALVSKAAEDNFLEMFGGAGLLISIEESKIDAASAVSGCGPAFVYMFIDALIDGGVRAGLPRETAKLLAEQTVLGSAKNALDTGTEPNKLKADVCSPAGSTIEGVAVLEEYSLRSAVIEAVMASYQRTVELGK